MNVIDKVWQKVTHVIFIALCDISDRARGQIGYRKQTKHLQNETTIHYLIRFTPTEKQYDAQKSTRVSIITATVEIATISFYFGGLCSGPSKHRCPTFTLVTSTGY